MTPEDRPLMKKEALALLTPDEEAAADPTDDAAPATPEVDEVLANDEPAPGGEVLCGEVDS
jgi:hypothetical protein